ncbi:MAG: hypothetical protein GX491_04250 [Chloroflexi bacterium]|nr:hypothetical protein [Chloroflexota bacterium]
MNPTLLKALKLLAHPFSLGAIGLLFVNDHLLRRLWPSWWTGKIGDAAWLFFFPFVMAVLLALLCPEKRRDQWVFRTAYGLTGIVFVLMKCIPAVNILATRIAAGLTDAPFALLPDPSDLLALPALGLSSLLWVSTPNPEPQRDDSRQPVYGLLALPIAALLTLANAAAPDRGIACFSIQDGQVYANSGYTAYLTTDGGRSWQAQPAAGLSCSQKIPFPGEWQEIQGPTESVRYRYKPGESIEFSNDAGQSWQAGMSLTPVSEAEQMYYIKSRPGNAWFDPGPMDAIADPNTGNMLFAMGHQGVLVREAGGEWVWSMTGVYRRMETFPDIDAFAVLLGGMIPMASGLAFLVFSTAALRLTFHPVRLVLLVLAWLAWLIVNIFVPPATSTSYGLTVTLIGMAAAGVIIVPLAVEQGVRLTRRAPHLLPRLIGLALAGGLLYLLPYVLWLYNAMPNFAWATAFGLLIGAAAAATGFLATRNTSQQNALFG